MTRRHRQRVATGKTLLLVDDDPEYLEATRLLLLGEGHEVLVADSGPAALERLRERPIDVLLLDYFMPGMTGEEVVTRLREFDHRVQIVLQTGYSDEQPPRAMLQRLDIQGYYDKAEGPERLLLWTDAALKSSRAIAVLQHRNRALLALIEATLRLHALPDLPRLLPAVVAETAALVPLLAAAHDGDTSPGVARIESVGLGLLDADGHLTSIPLAPAEDGAESPARALDPGELTALSGFLTGGESPLVKGPSTFLSLRVGPRAVGALLVRAPLPPSTLELLQRFADHAALAIAAALRVTPEPASTAPAPALVAELSVAWRRQLPLSIALLSCGPPNSSAAPPLTHAALRALLRPGDLLLAADTPACHLLLLPATARRGAARVLHRLLTRLPTRDANGAPLRWRAGLASLPTHRLPPAPRRPEAATLHAQATALLARARQAWTAAEPRAGVPLVSASDPAPPAVADPLPRA